MEHGERLSASEFRTSLHAMKKTAILPGLLRTMGRDGPIAPFSAGDVPIHIAWGSCDRVIPFARYGAPLQQTIAGASHSLIPGAGHVPMYDAPEALTTLILAITQGAEQGPAR
jgi:pimeloyl-ACP methyl ester carboxylesterase